MEKIEITKSLMKILSEKSFGRKMPKDYDSSDSLLSNGIIDSFGIFPFIHELERQFNIGIKNRDIHPGNFETIDNISSFIYKKKNN